MLTRENWISNFFLVVTVTQPQIFLGEADGNLEKNDFQHTLVDMSLSSENNEIEGIFTWTNIITGWVLWNTGTKTNWSLIFIRPNTIHQLHCILAQSGIGTILIPSYDISGIILIYS